MRRRLGFVLVALLFAALAANAYAQVVRSLLGLDDEPTILLLLQCASGTAAAAAAVGSWRERAWAPWAAALYGVITGAMIAALGPILDLDADARGGLWAGAAVLLALGGGCAWYLRRTLRRAAPRSPHTLA
jgi:hypothetical protein